MSDEHPYFWIAKVKESIEWVLVDRNKSPALSIVYILQCRETSRMKIGITQNLGQRMREIQAMSPTELKLVCSFVVQGQDVERFLHRMFEKYRLHGEWFKLPLSERLKLQTLDEELGQLTKQSQDERRKVLEEKEKAIEQQRLDDIEAEFLF